MLSDKYATVLITSDLEKLWSCEHFRVIQKKWIGQKPKSSGMAIRIAVNRAVKSPFCDAEAAWPVHPDDSVKIGFGVPGREYKVCSHQIDCD